MPFADFGLTLIPEWLDADDALLLTDDVPTGYHAALMGTSDRGYRSGIGGGSCRHYGCKVRLIVRSVESDCAGPPRLPTGIVSNYANCEAYNFVKMKDPVIFL